MFSFQRNGNYAPSGILLESDPLICFNDFKLQYIAYK